MANNLKVSDRVRFLGWRLDTPNLLATADALICPSRHEPLGNVILEAWAQERPVIAAASDGPKELIQNGKNGFWSQGLIKMIRFILMHLKVLPRSLTLRLKKKKFGTLQQT